VNVGLDPRVLFRLLLIRKSAFSITVDPASVAHDEHAGAALAASMTPAGGMAASLPRLEVLLFSHWTRHRYFLVFSRQPGSHYQPIVVVMDRDG
jgi:hypothetical protein